MIRKIIKLYSLTKKPKLVKYLLSFFWGGYFEEIGWLKSFDNHLPVDKNSNPLPWVTYSFIGFIESRLSKDMDVFEYGSGNSTNYYAKRVQSITSVEHDKEWYEEVVNEMLSNSTLIYQELEYGGDYSTLSEKQSIKYDIVIVDGRDRVNCLKSSINAIKDNGVIVLDDSEREPYKEGNNFLLHNNFKVINFWGISPGLFYNKCTSLYYKSNNCLGI